MAETSFYFELIILADTRIVLDDTRIVQDDTHIVQDDLLLTAALIKNPCLDFYFKPDCPGRYKYHPGRYK